MNTTDNRNLRIVVPNVMHSKVSCIKAIRMLTGLGLKESKDITDTPGEHHLYLDWNYVDPGIDAGVRAQRLEEQCRNLRNEGFEVGGQIHLVLQDLRNIAAKALEMGEDEFASEILQMVLAEKLRRAV